MADDDIIKLHRIEEIMDLEEGSLTLEVHLSDLEEWDSLAAISFMALVGSDYHRTVNLSELKKAITVQDLIGLI